MLYNVNGPSLTDDGEQVDFANLPEPDEEEAVLGHVLVAAVPGVVSILLDREQPKRASTCKYEMQQ